MPFSIQPRMNCVRWSRSSTQAPSGFRDGYAFAAHISGTWRAQADGIGDMVSVMNDTTPSDPQPETGWNNANHIHVLK